MHQLGFSELMTLQQRLLNFQELQASTYHIASKIAPWTDLEAKIYATHHRAIYFANQALLPVFTDITERAPTFRLEPLDTLNTKKSWVYVWTNAKNQEQAWLILLHHPFRGQTCITQTLIFVLRFAVRLLVKIWLLYYPRHFSVILHWQMIAAEEAGLILY